MNQTLAIVVLIGMMALTANIPFLSERLFGLIPLRSAGQPRIKSFWLRLVEVFVFYAVVVAIGFAFEAQIGNRFNQGWQFYAITLSLFLVCAYPGFVWRYLMRHRRAG